MEYVDTLGTGHDDDDSIVGSVNEKWDWFHSALWKAKRFGVRVWPGEWGIRVQGGQWVASSHTVCPLGALLLGLKYYPGENRMETVCRLTGRDMHWVCGYIAGFDGGNVGTEYTEYTKGCLLGRAHRSKIIQGGFDANRD